MYKVELTREPEKFIRRQNRKTQIQITSALRKLASQPRPKQAKKLAGMDDLYRVRAGDYRIVYTIEDKKLLVLVVRVAHRKEIYKKPF
ncbi:MAG: type II toxin-antitoxin system RelE/ParE family toxin [Deltaproteobacteria bacterium]|nr:type II toxin-antitoxin system RelE/ParE family toxin [Deltaproteobacteria bacterium]